jgi:hypothetical protein
MRALTYRMRFIALFVLGRATQEIETDRRPLAMADMCRLQSRGVARVNWFL